MLFSVYIYAKVSIIFSILYALIGIIYKFCPDILAQIFNYFNITHIEKPYLIVSFIFIAYVTFFVSHKYKQIDVKKHTVKELENELEILENLNYLPNDIETVPIKEEEKIFYWRDFKLNVNKSIRQFVIFWFIFWCCWFVFYFIFVLKEYFFNEIPLAFLNLASNINSLMCIFLFMTLTVTTSKYGFAHWIRFLLIVGLVLIAEIFFKYKTSNGNFEFWFSLSSGIFSGISFALLLSSINSKFIDIPLSILIFLYFYVIIQALYVFISIEPNKNDDNFKVLYSFSRNLLPIIFTLAFFLKVLLFLTITWLLKTGKLAYFMVQETSLLYEKGKRFLSFMSKIKLVDSSITKSQTLL